MTTAETALQEFARTFFGYGTWSAPYWFVGMEEGGIASPEHLNDRVRAWIAEGRPAIVDLPRYQRRLGGLDWFADGAPLQRTWRPLMRAVLVANGIEPTRERLREYQRTRLGREDGETALLELLPFPSPKTSEWPYEQLGIAEYATRESYRSALEPERSRRLKEAIETHQPKAVVFYGYPEYWRTHFPDEHVGATRILVMRHPTAHGTTNEDWDDAGRKLR